MQKRRRNGIIAIFLSGLCVESYAASTSSQVHARLGMVSGSYSGPTTGSFSVTNSLDGEYEIFTSSRSATSIRAIIAYRMADLKLLYSYFGIGRRYYFLSDGIAYENSDAGAAITSSPTWRFYYGGDIGLSQVNVTSSSTKGSAALQSVSAGLDVGPLIGSIYQVSKSMGLEAQLGLTYAYGITTTAVTAITTRFLLGVSVYF